MTHPSQPESLLDMLALAKEREQWDQANKALKMNSLLAGHSATAEAERFLVAKSTAVLIAAEEVKRIEEMQKLLNPYEDIQRLLKSDASIHTSALAATAKQQYQMTAASMVADRVAAQAFLKHLDHDRDIAKRFEASFHLPSMAEAKRVFLNLQLDGGTMAAYARHHVAEMASQEELIASFTKPWMREIEAARSASALLELQGLGWALQSIRGFDHSLTSALRTDFGDWRDRISFPQDVFEDPVARTEFYVRRGFNTSLTAFPEETFRESLLLTGLDTGETDVIEWPEAMHARDPIEEAAFQRTNKCQNHLQRLERRLRQFIDKAMTTQYGADWPKKRLSPQMLESWEHKKSKEEGTGKTLTMFIEVADFTDYEVIICRKDHWREVFQSRFYRSESVRESFQRLYPIRRAAMHSRFVTKEDELYVLAESQRLLSAIGK